MEELSDHLGGGNATSGTSNYHHLSASSVTATASSPPPQTAVYGRNSFYLHHPPPPLNPGAAQGVVEEEHGEICAGDDDIEELKAKIMAHPHYSRLATAFLDCQKVGAPPEVEAKLSAVARAIESRSGCRLEPISFEPELDLFMEAYCDLMIKYREELTRLFQDATDFIKGAESQFNSLINATCSLPLFSSADHENCEGLASPEEDPDASCGETDVSEIDPNATSDKELKLHLLKKYSGFLGSLRQQLSKTKKKGKLPKEARQKLLSWWELHYRWPYPSESEKVALAESTGLDQKQINNWFINQRKRHWKPTEETQFIMADGFHPQNDANIFVQGRQYMSDGLYRIAPP